MRNKNDQPPMMASRISSSYPEYFLLCVDERTGDITNGRIFNPYLSEPLYFTGIYDLLSKVIHCMYVWERPRKSICKLRLIA